MENIKHNRTEDLTKRVFDKLTVIDFVDYKNGAARWNCLCKCGNKKIVFAEYLKKGYTKSCGCVHFKSGEENHNFRDLTKEILPNRIIALKFLYTDKKRKAVWKFRCFCGNIFETLGNSVISKKTKSCGCLNHLKGKDSPRWNPNLTDEERTTQRNTLENTFWRKFVYIRDNYTCQCCGNNKGHNLEAHHKENWADNPELRYDLNNGITLCKECHKAFHKKYGYCNTTSIQITQFIIGNRD